MRSTMQDVPLTVGSILRHGSTVFGGSQVVTWLGQSGRNRSFAAIGERCGRLANALHSLGVDGDDRVATFQWNNAEHVEVYLAVPAMGGVLHTLNIRLFPEQLVYVVNHAEDKVVIVDASLVPLLAKVVTELKTLEHIVVVGAADTDVLAVAPVDIHDYEALLAGQDPAFDWPQVDEHDAAAMCYTSGTTGNPKGVVYSHRSTWLHSLTACTANGLGVSADDRVLPIVPMFHANAWGLVHAAFQSGADLVMPDRFLAAEPLVALIESERPTISGAVPTIWNDLLRYGESHPMDLSSLRLVACGGSAVPLKLMQAFEEQYGVRILQAWGMTETSPLASVARPPRGLTGVEAWRYRSCAGRVVAGVEARVTQDDGTVLAADGASVGEIEVRGPWVTASYYLDEDEAKFHAGWLRTGDVGHLDTQGYLTLTDRAKDVIKSGGEWISSVELENTLMAHPEVVEAAVVGVPDQRWGERPLACVVSRAGSGLEAPVLAGWLEPQIPKWWLPERWTFIDAVPRTSVGKFDKKVLRAQYADGALSVETLGGSD